ncbi:MAG: baseplate J/gp47 family protein [Ruminococcus sp.]|nr:baseplate J/gp47 family protein [Ruminococcus sp.]
MDSYENILSGMKEKYTELSGNEIPEGSDIDIRMKVLAGEIFENEVSLDFIKRQMFASTATGEYLDKHAEDRGIKRNEAVKARGEVTFTVDTVREEPIVIPKDTIVGTSGDTCVRFVTDRAATLNAGNMGVDVPCTAEVAGFEGNVAEWTIDVIISNVVGIDDVGNSDAFRGGSDAESDESLRGRVLNTYVSISNGTNAAYYKKLAESVEGVKSANVISHGRGAGTVDVYVGGYNGQVSSAVVANVQRLLDEQRELNVDIQVAAATAENITIGIVVMKKNGYDFNDVSSRIRQALDSYITSLGVGDDIIEAYMSRVIISVDGVYDFYWLTNYNTTFPMNNNQFGVLNTIIIEEGSW